MPQDFVTDIKTLRERARKHIENGAVTEGYKADRETVVKLLNEALATELVCVLRYKLHYFMYGGPVALVEGDIGEAAVRDRYLQAALDIKGEIYGLVALPGDPARVKPEELDAEALRASFAANYEAPVLLARATAERMVRQGTKGAIVLMSSMQGVHPFEGSLAYAGPKAALVQAGRILAKEYGGPADIRVNVVAPGATIAGMYGVPTAASAAAAHAAIRP